MSEHCRKKGGHFLIALEGSADPDPTQAALKLDRELACCGASIPKAGFIGGTSQHAFLALIMQPLGIDAFEMLWGIQAFSSQDHSGEVSVP